MDRPTEEHERPCADDDVGHSGRSPLTHAGPSYTLNSFQLLRPRVDDEPTLCLGRGRQRSNSVKKGRCCRCSFPPLSLLRFVRIGSSFGAMALFTLAKHEDHGLGRITSAHTEQAFTRSTARVR